MCGVPILPAEDLRLLAFKVLVNCEEVFDFTQDVRTDVRVILEFYIPGIPAA